MNCGEAPGADADGDPVALRFQALRDRLVGTSYYVLGHRDDANEAVQEAFVRCWRARGRVRGVVNDEHGAVTDLDAWIFTVVLNTSKDLRRRRRVRRAEALPTEETMHPVSPEPGPVAVAERRDALARIRALIHTLPDAEREVFLLRQNGDLTFEAIAATLGAPVGTVKTRMRAALRRLREALEPRSRLEGSPR